MKNTHKLCGAVLLAAVGLAVALPSNTKAAPETLAGEGKVEFTKDTTPDTVTIPGETTEISQPPVNPETGDLMVIAVSPLDFDKHAILASGSQKTHDVKPFTTTETAGGTSVSMENFVSFKDMRSTTDHSYELQAQLTKQFTNTGVAGNPILKGASITYSNLRVVTTGDTGLMPTPEAGSITLDNADGSANIGDAKTFINNTGNADGAIGYGEYSLVFGNKTVTDSVEKSVQLNVPANLALTEGVYTAEITWSFITTP